jgi:hypothetical protein
VTQNGGQAILQVSSAPSRAAYDAVHGVLGLTSDRPAGMIVHAAAEQADGSVLIVDVWDSDSAMDTFERDQLFPAFEALPGGPGAAMAQRPVRHPAFEIVKG